MNYDAGEIYSQVDKRTDTQVIEKMKFGEKGKAKDITQKTKQAKFQKENRHHYQCANTKRDKHYGGRFMHKPT
jgi:hypothetical protein